MISFLQFILFLFIFFLPSIHSSIFILSFIHVILLNKFAFFHSFLRQLVSVVTPGQLLRRPSTPKPFIEPGFSYFFDVKFFCVCFPVVKGFSLRLLCLFSNSFSSNSSYILYIFMFIYFIFVFIVLIVDLLIIHNSFFLVFAVVSLWHVIEKPLPYN